MQLHEALGTRQKYKKPRVGRGGKRGTTAGKGTKGQKARAGRRIRPAERDYIQRLPKLRGHKQKPTREPALPLNLSFLDARFKGNVISERSLQEAGLLYRGQRAKILGSGEIHRPLTVEGVAVSASAKAKIEKAGGKVN